MKTAALILLALTTMTAHGQERYSLQRNVAALGLAVIEGAANATMDTIDHHGERSVFSDSEWWMSEWGYVKARREAGWPVQIADGWHAMKTLQLTTWISIALVFDNRGFRWYEYVLWGIAIGTVRNLSFNLFYDRILLR